MNLKVLISFVLVGLVLGFIAANLYNSQRVKKKESFDFGTGSVVVLVSVTVVTSILGTYLFQKFKKQ